MGRRSLLWVWLKPCSCSTGALSIQLEIPVISVGTSNGTDRFGLVRPEYSWPVEGGPLWPVWSFRSVRPKCPFPLAKIFVPSTALFYPAYKNKYFPVESEVLWAKHDISNSLNHLQFFSILFYLPLTVSNNWRNTTRRWKKVCVIKLQFYKSVRISLLFVWDLSTIFN